VDTHLKNYMQLNLKFKLKKKLHASFEIFFTIKFLTTLSLIFVLFFNYNLRVITKHIIQNLSEH
jgi:hypothetical protein